MRKRIDRQLVLLHEECERERRCTVGAHANMRRWLKDRREARLLVSPHPGLYARPEYWNALSPTQRSLHVIRALARLHPEWVFCFTSAAIVHGLEVAFLLTSATHVLSSHSGVRAGITFHAYPMEDRDVECIDGVRVTSLPRTALDCTRGLSFPFGLAIADSALRQRGWNADALLEYVDERGAGCRGVGRARVAARFASPLSENGGESYARAVMLENGVREPELQVPFDDWMNPGCRFRVDYLWRVGSGLDVAGELDGRDKIEQAPLLGGMTPVDALREERQRESRLTARLRVARFTYRQARAVTPLLRILSEYGVPMDEDAGAILRPYRRTSAKDRYAHLR